MGSEDLGDLLGELVVLLVLASISVDAEDLVTDLLGILLGRGLDLVDLGDFGGDPDRELGHGGWGGLGWWVGAGVG